MLQFLGVSGLGVRVPNYHADSQRLTYINYYPVAETCGPLGASSKTELPGTKLSY